MSYCEGCIYRKTFSGWLEYCDYMCMTDQRRPCPAGDGCTVKTTRRGRRRKEYTPEEKEKLAELHRKRRREYKRAKYLTRTPEEIEKQREYNREQYQKHKAERNAKHREYYQANKERLNAYSREHKRKKRASENGKSS